MQKIWKSDALYVHYRCILKAENGGTQDERNQQNVKNLTLFSVVAAYYAPAV